MSRSLILLDAGLDRLWRRYLPGLEELPASAHDSDDYDLIDLGEMSASAGYPHGRNVFGWRRWLKERPITQLHCYQPRDKAFPILAAAASLKLDIRIHLTGQLGRSSLNRLKFLASKITHFHCVGRFIAHQLHLVGIDVSKTHSAAPTVRLTRVGENRPQQIRRYLTSGSPGPLLLALAQPNNTSALKPLVWATAILKHLIPNLKLVMAGPCSPNDVLRLQKWQYMWDAADMICLTPQTSQWDELAAACDMIVVGDKNLLEVIRLLHAREANRTIVAADGPAREFLQGYPQTRLVKSAGPRPFAAAVLALIDHTPCPCP